MGISKGEAVNTKGPSLNRRQSQRCVPVSFVSRMCPHSHSHPHPHTYPCAWFGGRHVIANNHPLNVMKLYVGDGPASLLARTLGSGLRTTALIRPHLLAHRLSLSKSAQSARHLDTDSASHNNVYCLLAGHRVHANGFFVHLKKYIYNL